MKVITLFFIYSSFCFSLNGTQIVIKPKLYNRYVVPAFKDISRLYGKMLVHQGHSTEEMNLRNQISDLVTIATKTSSKCIENDCQHQHDNLYAKIEKTRDLLKKLKKEKVTINAEQKLIIMKEQARLMVIFPKSQKSYKLDLLNMSLELYSDYNLHLINTMKGPYKEHLLKLWNFYISSFEKVIIPRGPQSLKKMMKKLNLAWHEFHLIMTKREKDVPGTIKQLVFQINSRWNSSIKLLL